MTPEQRYELADKAVHDCLLLLAGRLSAEKRYEARIELIRAVGRKVKARIALEARAELLAA
jgi:hypothetical protein